MSIFVFIREFSVAILIWFSVWVGHREHVVVLFRATESRRLGDDASTSEVSLHAVVPLGGADWSQARMREAALTQWWCLFLSLQERHWGSLLLFALELHRLRLLLFVSVNIFIKFIVGCVTSSCPLNQAYFDISNVDVSIFIMLHICFLFISYLKVYYLFRLLPFFWWHLLQVLSCLLRFLPSLIVLDR